MNRYFLFFLWISLILSEISDKDIYKNIATDIYLYLRDNELDDENMDNKLRGFCETYLQILWDIDYTNVWDSKFMTLNYALEDFQNISKKLSEILQKSMNGILNIQDIELYDDCENNFLQKYDIWHLKQVFLK